MMFMELSQNEEPTEQDTDQSQANHQIHEPTSQPGQWWGVAFSIILSTVSFILTATILFTLLYDVSKYDAPWALAAIFQIYMMPLAGVMLLVGSILSVAYLVKYRPTGKSALLPIVTIVVTALAIIIVASYVISGEIASNRSTALMQEKESLLDSKLQNVESLFSNYGYEGSSIGMYDESTPYETYLPVELQFIRYDQIARGNFANIESQTTDHLADQGFKRDDSSEGVPYYISGNDNANKNGYVVLRYTRDEETLAVKYHFDKPIDCPRNTACRHLSEDTPDAETYPISRFDQELVTEFTARYTDVVDSKFSSFDADYAQ